MQTYLLLGFAILLIVGLRKEVKEKMNALLEKLQALTVEVTDAKNQVDKARVEVVGKIGALETSVADLTAALEAAQNPVTPEVQAALDAVAAAVVSLKVSTQAVDDVVPDAPVEPPVA